jgi:hypothetical protein
MANVKLSARELDLVNNAEFILTKNNIISKVYELFGGLSSFYVSEMKQRPFLQEEILSIPPKISKGENYNGLPWVLLDYPRYFTNKEELAIRTYFWWGNFCSITLQASGKFQQQIQGPLELFHRSNEAENWFLCCGANKWVHHFGADNYKILSNFSAEEIRVLPFIKLAKKIPLNKWDGIETFMQESFSTLQKVLSKMG